MTTTTQASARRLSIVLSPFSRARSSALIVRPDESEDSSRFAHLYRLDPAEALRFCDDRLRLADPANLTEGVRWSSRVAMCQRALKSFRESARTHLLAEPLVRLITDPLVRGNHHNGRGFALAGLGDYEGAIKAHESARDFFIKGECLEYAAAAENNLGVVLIKSGRPEKALPLIERAMKTAERLEQFELAEECADTLRQAYASLSSGERAAPQRGK